MVGKLFDMNDLAGFGPVEEVCDVWDLFTLFVRGQLFFIILVVD